MRQQFNKINLFLLLTSVTFLFSCTDDKDLYDPERENENPLEVTAPSDFGWQTTRSTSVKVEVKDEFNGAFNYGIKIYDLNPVTEEGNAKVLASGVAKQGQPFTSQIALPVSVESVFIKQTAPDGLVSVRYATITNGSINSNFGTVTNRSTRSAATTRATSIDKPTKPTITSDMFPTAVPGDATELTSNWVAGGTETAYKNFELKQNVSSINIGYYASIYVSADVTISGYESSNRHRNIYILPGRKLTISGAFNHSSTENVITIGEGAELIVEGNMDNTGIDNGVYNKGKVTIEGSFKTSNSATVYNIGSNSELTIGTNFNIALNVLVFNEGKLTIGDTYDTVGATVTYNEGTLNVKTLKNQSTLINDNTITCDNAELTASSKTENNGDITVNGLTDVRSRDTWINNGTWITNTMTTYSYYATYYNRCKLIANEKLNFEQVRFINDAGAYVYAAEMHMKNTRVAQGTEAFFHVVGVASLEENRISENEGFYGTGEGLALLKMGSVVPTTSSPNIVYYSGNLGIICDNHPEMGTSSHPIWSMDGNVIWSSSESNAIDIPKTECNEGNPSNPDPNPGDKDPEPEPYPYPFTFLFEDLWPFYGDYDMNDAVIQITQITKFKNDNNAVTALSFDYSLKAVGAGSSLGAALMLDAINASNVSSVTYSSNAPSGFEVASSGVESGQTNAVIPLFPNAHGFLGRNPGQFVNTVKGSSTNVTDVPTVTVKIEFSTAVSDNFDATTFNMFIIPSSSPGAITSTNRKEVHLLGYSPSNRANTSYFGNNDDRSIGNKYYVSRDNLSWAIVVPYDFRWPIEYKSIKEAYAGFAKWVTSGGTENTDWWLTPASEADVY